jgi:hypothetical protein
MLINGIEPAKGELPEIDPAAGSEDAGNAEARCN